MDIERQQARRRGRAYLVVAAVHVQIRGRRNGGDESEERAEDVQDQGEDGVDSQGVLNRGGDQVEEREHREDRDEHVVVDDRRSALDCDHVTDQSHTEQNP